METHNFRSTHDTTEPKHGLSVKGDRLIPPFRAVAAEGKPFLAIMMAIPLLLLTLVLACSPRSSGTPLATLSTSDFHTLAFHPQDPNIIFFGHHNGVLKSVDGGRTWLETSFRGRGWDAMGMAISPGEPQHIYVAGHDVFSQSRDGGQSWAPLRHNLPGTDIHGFAMDPDNPNKLYAFVVGYGVYGSDNAGSNWQLLSNRLPGDIMALAAAGGQTLYAGSMERGVLKSTDGGKTWVQANTGIEGRNAMTLAVDPKQPQTIYAGTEKGLFKSADAASSWQKLAFPGENAVAVAVAPSNPQVVIAIAVGNDRKGSVYRSEDGGHNW